MNMENECGNYQSERRYIEIMVPVGEIYKDTSVSAGKSVHINSNYHYLPAGTVLYAMISRAHGHPTDGINSDWIDPTNSAVIASDHLCDRISALENELADERQSNRDLCRVLNEGLGGRTFMGEPSLNTVPIDKGLNNEHRN
jgi:hypothetical protein